MKKSLALLAITILVLFTQPVFAEDKIEATTRLGITVPLTGDFASYGELIRKGVQLASEDLRAEGFKTELFFEDACLPAGAVSTIQKLIAVDHINAVAANFCLIAVPPMAPALERNKILTFHTASVSDSILDAGKFIFGTNVKVRDEARRDAEYAWNTLGAKTASIFFIATDFGEDYNKHFTIRFEELGGMSRSPFFEHIVLNQ